MPGKLLQDQGAVSRQFPLMTDDVSTSSSVQTISAETIQLYYSNSGARTIDAGQAAGTAVSAQIANKNILDAAGGYIATKDDTSLSFTSTAFTNEVAFPFKGGHMKGEEFVNGTWAEKLDAITAGFSNGDYCVDYRSGTMYGVKASTQVTLTGGAYSLNLAQSGAGGGLTGDIRIIGTGDATNAAKLEDAAHASGDAGIHMLAVRDDALAAKAGTDGDYASISVDDTGYLYVRNRGYDTSSDALKAFETAPIWAQHVEETIADVTNETDATTNYYIDMDGYSGLNLQLIISGGSGTMTVTIAASAQDDGTAAASATYQDVTNEVFGAASFTATTYLFDDQKTLGGSKFVRIQTVSSTGGSNDADITIYAKRLF